jgi:hypothetical protein
MRGDSPTDTDPILTAKRRTMLPPAPSFWLLRILKMNSLMMKLKMMKPKKLKKPPPPMKKPPQLAKFWRAPLRNMHEKLWSCLT